MFSTNHAINCCESNVIVEFSIWLWIWNIIHAKDNIREWCLMVSVAKRLCRILLEYRIHFGWIFPFSLPLPQHKSQTTSYPIQATVTNIHTFATQWCERHSAQASSFMMPLDSCPLELPLRPLCPALPSIAGFVIIPVTLYYICLSVCPFCSCKFTLVNSWGQRAFLSTMSPGTDLTRCVTLGK